MRVYAAEAVSIYDSQGKESKSTSHDTEFWKSVVKAKEELAR